MDALLPALAGLLAASAVAFVARPYLRNPPGDTDDLPSSKDQEHARLRLLEDVDRALEALKELEFDYRAGKVVEEDYQQLLGPLRRRAAEALRALVAERVDGSLDSGQLDPDIELALRG